MDILGDVKKPEEFLGNSLLKKEKQPVLFMHEIPQILFEDQLFVYQAKAIEKVGYVKGENNQNIQIPNIKKIVMTIDYIKKLLLKRGVEN